MAINFPNSPSLGQLYNYSGTTWQWSGEYWNVYSAQTGYITSVSNAGNGYPVIDSVTSNALTLKSFSGTNLTITDSGGQLNFYVPLNGGGGGQLYYFNISQTQTPYLELATTATTSAQQTITSATTSGSTVTLGQFLTPSGYPGVSIIPGGVWSFYLHSYKQNSSASFDIYCDVYKRTSGGTETLLFSTDPAPVLSDSPTPIMVLTDNYFSGTTLSTSDRLLVNVRATNTSNNTYSITFVSEGSQHYSYVSSPLLLRTTDVYVNSFTYTPSANTLTIGQTESYPSQTAIINSFTGLTINGNLSVTGTTSSGTISATTYQNLPTYISATTLSSANVLSVTTGGGSPSTSTVNAVTGGTYNSSTGVITLSGTGSVNGNTITGFSTGGGGGLTWNSSNTTQSMTADNGYVTTASTLTTFTLPSTIAFGKTVEIAGNSTGLWQLNQNSGQQIRFGNTATTVTSGILSATSQGDCVKLICTSANTSFIVTSSMGNIFFS